MSAVLHENKFVRQTPGEPHLRWFRSDYFDLFLWQDEAGEMCRFQLCYDLAHDEHALTWTRDVDTLDHHAVDDGEEPGEYSASPILCEARHATPRELAERFRAASESLPQAAQELILRVLVKAPACAARPAQT